MFFRPAARLIVVLAVATTVAGASPKKDEAPAAAAFPIEPINLREGPQPITVVRRLSEVQEQIARGNSAELATRQQVSEEIAKLLRGFALDSWKHPLNRLALVRYALSGGDASLLGELLDAGSFPKAESALAEGAMAFANRDREEARELLQMIDPRSLDAATGGVVALVKAVLALPDQPAEAARLCEIAGLLSPGTHIEEAALRMAIDAAIIRGEANEFVAAARRFMTRFPSSVYSKSIRTRIARIAGALDLAAREEGRRAIRVMIYPLRLDQQEEFLFEMAAAALRTGKFETARFAGAVSIDAASGPQPGAISERRRILSAAARIFTNDTPQELHALAAMEGRSGNGELDELVATGLSVVRSIEARSQVLERSLAKRFTGASPVQEVPASRQRRDRRHDAGATVTSAKARIAEVDRILERSRAR